MKGRRLRVALSLVIGTYTIVSAIPVCARRVHRQLSRVEHGRDVGDLLAPARERHRGRNRPSPCLVMESDSGSSLDGTRSARRRDAASSTIRSG